MGGVIFLYLTSEYKQCKISADLPVPLGLFSIQNTEGHVVQEICINVVRRGQLLFSETPCPLSHFHYRRAFALMVNVLALHYNARLGGFLSTDDDLSISNRVLPAVAAWQIHHSAAKLATSWRKVSDVGEPNTL